MSISLAKRICVLTALMFGVFLLSACGVLNKAEVTAVESIASAIPANSWDELLQNFTEDNLCAAPGAVLLVDAPDGRFLKSIGVSSVEDQTPLKVSDAFEIGSNTKSFTVVLALQVQEDGVWSLDDPLSNWLPEAAAQIPNGDEVTLRQMAGNTSGIWDYANPLLGAGVSDESLRQKTYTPEEIVAYAVENGKPDFAPGKGWAYSTTNFVLLGMAIEAATGRSIADLYQEQIFTPAGMTNTFLLNGSPQAGQVAQGYFVPESEEDEKPEYANVTDWNASQGWAGGGIVSTAEDMAAYIAALSSGELFDDPDSLVQMTAFNEVDPAKAGLLTDYGLGLGVFPVEFAHAWGHHGQTLGFTTLFMTVPEKETNIVYLTNSSSCSAALIAATIKEPLIDGSVAE